MFELKASYTWSLFIPITVLNIYYYKAGLSVNYKSYYIKSCSQTFKFHNYIGGRRGRDRMVVGF